MPGDGFDGTCQQCQLPPGSSGLKNQRYQADVYDSYKPIAAHFIVALRNLAGSSKECCACLRWSSEAPVATEAVLMLS